MKFLTLFMLITSMNVFAQDKISGKIILSKFNPEALAETRATFFDSENVINIDGFSSDNHGSFSRDEAVAGLSDHMVLRNAISNDQNIPKKIHQILELLDASTYAAFEVHTKSEIIGTESVGCEVSIELFEIDFKYDVTISSYISSEKSCSEVVLETITELNQNLSENIAVLEKLAEAKNAINASLLRESKEQTKTEKKVKEN